MNSKATSLNLANLKNDCNENIINLTGLIRFLLASGNRIIGKRKINRYKYMSLFYFNGS